MVVALERQRAVKAGGSSDGIITAACWLLLNRRQMRSSMTAPEGLIWNAAHIIAGPLGAGGH